MDTGAGFRICGYVVRKFVVPSGKCAFLVLDVPGDNGRSSKIELRTFDAVEDVGSLVIGGKCQVTGRVDMEKITSKDRKPVMIDGREKWAPALTIKAVSVDGASIPPRAPVTPAGGNGEPEGW